MNPLRMSPGILLLFFTLSVAGGNEAVSWRESDAPRIFEAAPGGLRVAALSPAQRYDEECSQCHGDAAEFVSDALEFRDGVLTGRYSQQPVLDFLKSHRSLKPADAEFYRDLLQRVAVETGLQ